jgi:diadenosine tetraphosphate (Ap4A) HIT family hydrolase
MEISNEQIEEFKKQVISQIETTFPEEKKNSAIESINSMNEEEFLEFLKKNNLISSDSSKENQELNQNKTPFRLIIEGKIPSYVIDENKYSMGVLEIKPVSKGHIIIIPKDALSESSKIPKSILSLANIISKRIKAKLKPKEVLISSSNSLGEVIINIIPVYSNESINSPRKQTSNEELEELKNILEKKSKPKTIKAPKIKKIEESKIWLPRRIP